jgi:hypothetical protein
MTTRQDLKDTRGLIASYIMSDSRLQSVWGPEMADYTEDGVTRNFWVEESATRIVAMGHITTVPQFLQRFNKWMENPPKRFSIPQLLLLEHTMGVPSHEWERLPSYHQKNPHPANMSDVDAGRANARQTAAWSQFHRMNENLNQTFGDDDMCNEFDSKTSGVVFGPVEGLYSCPDGVTRMVFTNGKTLLVDMQANEAKWAETLETNDLVRMMMPDNSYVVDIVPHTLMEAYTAHAEAHPCGCCSERCGSTESNPIVRSNAA